MLTELCRQYTDLNTKEIERLQEIACMLPYFCELFNGDIFIDGFIKDSENGVVLAHGRPEADSLYRTNIAGELVLPQKEPIVFFTQKTGAAIRDAKAVTQEDKMVLQKTMPIRNEEGTVIAVLIAESDITSAVNKEKKMDAMKYITEQLDQVNQDLKKKEKKLEESTVMLREMHHRIKNNLQTVSSILSMQERRSSCEETKTVLRENINRINSIASVHELLLMNHHSSLLLQELLEKLLTNMRLYAGAEDKNIEMVLAGESLSLDGEKAQAVVLVVNELLTNSIQHGYKNRTSGKITLEIAQGILFNSIVVEDDGEGFDCKETADGFGLSLIRTIVKDKLRGELKIESSPQGTRIRFDFL